MRSECGEQIGFDGPTRASPAEMRLLVAAFSRVRPTALGVSLAAVVGGGLFLATAVLLLLALGQSSEYPVGTHLGRFSNYLPGYDVTWPGAFVGLLYGLGGGFVTGACLGGLLNLSHSVYVRVVRRRMRRGVIDEAL